MDRLQPTKRSASHGPLDQSHGGDASFLLSPAPLDTMLRKTTETGDIGIFSIGPTRSLGRSRLPVAPDPTKPKLASVMPPRAMGPPGPDVDDDRRTLPSYRYNNSESDSASSGSRCFSLPSRIDGRRSDSMTSCSSGSTSLQRGRPRPGRMAGVWNKPTYPTRGSGWSTDLSETSHIPWENRCHNSQEWTSSTPGQRSSSQSGRACHRLPLKPPSQPPRTSGRYPSHSWDTSNRFGVRSAAHQAYQPAAFHRGLGRADVSD